MGATYFFRDYHTLKMIPSYVIPMLMENRGDDEERINIWSAGCANGSEPYTVALILKDTLDSEIFNRVDIYATDIDPNNRFGRIISRGSYSENALKKVPEEIFIENFKEEPGVYGSYAISEKIKNKIVYVRHDLNSMVPPLNRKFEIIICKNVLIHFRLEKKLDIIKMFYDSLTDGGFLITEQTQKIPSEIGFMFSQFVGSAQIHRKI